MCPIVHKTWKPRATQTLTEVGGCHLGQTPTNNWRLPGLRKALPRRCSTQTSQPPPPGAPQRQQCSEALLAGREPGRAPPHPLRLMATADHCCQTQAQRHRSLDCSLLQVTESYKLAPKSIFLSNYLASSGFRLVAFTRDFFAWDHSLGNFRLETCRDGSVF